VLELRSKLSENLLLNSMPPGLQRRLERDLTEVHLKTQQVLLEAGSGAKDVYFPTTCVLSLVSQVADGQSVATAVVGREGMVGLSLFLSAANLRTIVQIDGQALKMPASAFLGYLDDPDFRAMIGGFSETVLASACQSAACQAFHTAEQRLARWLLTIRDRVTVDELPLTQDFLASMLGVYRPTVTVAARILQAADLIHYRYGKVTVVDRQGLEEAACECYLVMSNGFGPSTMSVIEGKPPL
jgi:CRP-like cAMP-binding protein